MSVMISVVIPTLNRPILLERAIASVMRQTYQHWEILVVDNGRDLRNRLIVEKFTGNNKRILYLEETKQGPGAARNTGVRAANADLVAFLDDDDFWYESKLARQVDFILENPNNAFICGLMNVIDTQGNIVGEKPVNKHAFASYSELIKQNSVVTSTVIVKKSVVTKVGMFDETLLSAQDYDLWLRISLKHSFAIMQETLGGYQEHANKISHNIERAYINLNTIYSKQLSIAPHQFHRTIKKLLSITHCKLGMYYKSIYGFRSASFSYFRAIQINYAVGASLREFTGAGQNIFVFFLCVIKPYIALFYCLVRSIFRGGANVL